MKEFLEKNIQNILFAVIGIFLMLVLLASAFSENIVYKSRTDGTCTIIQEASFEQIEDKAAPTGIVNIYRFNIDEVVHADTLAFYINHHNIEVYFDEECVYSVLTGEDVVRTVGGIWAMLPLYESDEGRQVSVVLYPLYSDYQNKVPVFYRGSELAIYKAVFYQAFPELVLDLCVTLIGVFLLCFLFYYTVRHNILPRLYAIGLLAVSAGIWRFTYGKFCYLLLTKHTVLLYSLSIISLMGVALSMLYCVKFPEDKKGNKMLSYVSVIYCIIYIVQLALQALGILDLRQMLKVTHATIIVSVVLIFMMQLFAWFRYTKGFAAYWKQNNFYILGIGVIMDLLLYYITDTSVGMVFTLTAILCFSVLEAISFFNKYTQQKVALEEMEVKLVISRTTIMMSQIRSHFVFNILNAISGMCKYDPEKADDTVVRFSRYLRNNIDIMENDKNIPFAVDLKQLEDYVILEQVRFGDKVEFYTDIETDDFMIPPLILQPVVENAIRHGVSKKLTNGSIILRTHDTGKNIVITVEDDGIGFDLAELEKQESVGLKNIRFRLQHLVNGTLDIASQIGKGTVVTITIPKKEEEKV